MVETDSKKSKWNIFKFLSKEVIFAALTLLFTYIYNARQQEIASANLELAKSNYKIASTQIKASLLKPLLSADPRERAMAIYLAEALDGDFAVAVARSYALKDPDNNVRSNAGNTLRNLAQSPDNAIKAMAVSGVQQYEIMNEIRAKNLQEKLEEAESYIRGGNISGQEKALNIYEQVITSLSASSQKSLDQKLLKAAKDDVKGGHIENAIQKYRSLFAGYR